MRHECFLAATKIFGRNIVSWCAPLHPFFMKTRQKKLKLWKTKEQMRFINTKKQACVLRVPWQLFSDLHCTRVHLSLLLESLFYSPFQKHITVHFLKRTPSGSVPGVHFQGEHVKYYKIRSVPAKTVCLKRKVCQILLSTKLKKAGWHLSFFKLKLNH